MPEKCESSGARLTEKPCMVTQRRTLRPSAPILASVPPRSTQMPIRPGERRAATPRSPSVAISQAFERVDESADVAAAPVEVDQHIADALAGAVIGVAAAAPGRVDRESPRG